MAYVKGDKVIAALREYEPGYSGLIGAVFTYCFGRVETAQGFKRALALGLIERIGTGGMGNPIYRRTTVA